MDICANCGSFINYDAGYGINDEEQDVCKACTVENPIWAKWGVWKITDNELHVKPTDEGDHISDINLCSCGPVLTVENGVNIWVHTSFDGREVIDQMIDVVLNYRSNSGK